MSAEPVREREEVRRLVELVPDADLPTVRRMLAGLTSSVDPVLAAIRNAPLDDEEVTEEDVAAWEEGKEDLAAGRVLSTEELRHELGI